MCFSLSFWENILSSLVSPPRFSASCFSPVSHLSHFNALTSLEFHILHFSDISCIGDSLYLMPILSFPLIFRMFKFFSFVPCERYDPKLSIILLFGFIFSFSSNFDPIPFDTATYIFPCLCPEVLSYWFAKGNLFITTQFSARFP